MADRAKKVTELPTKNTIANGDLWIVGNTTNTYTSNTTVVRNQLFSPASNASIPVPSYSITSNTVPFANQHSNGHLIYVSDGANGSPCYATSNGTQWLIVATIGTVISNS